MCELRAPSFRLASGIQEEGGGVSLLPPQLRQVRYHLALGFAGITLYGAGCATGMNNPWLAGVYAVPGWGLLLWVAGKTVPQF